MERDDLCGRIAQVGPISRKLNELRDLSYRGDVRGSNFMMCVENVMNRNPRALPGSGQYRQAHLGSGERSVIVRRIGALNISPPLVLTEAQIDELVRDLAQDILPRCVSKAEGFAELKEPAHRAYFPSPLVGEGLVSIKRRSRRAAFVVDAAFGPSRGLRHPPSP